MESGGVYFEHRCTIQLCIVHEALICVLYPQDPQFVSSFPTLQSGSCPPLRNISDQPERIRSFTSIEARSGMETELLVSGPKRRNMNLDGPALGIDQLDEIQIIALANIPVSIESISSGKHSLVQIELGIAVAILHMVDLNLPAVGIVYLDEEQIRVVDPPIAIAKEPDGRKVGNSREGGGKAGGVESSERRSRAEGKLHLSRDGVIGLDSK